jgi:LDH2 family malate/lactate/ureidoglycolate dehydrogenase
MTDMHDAADPSSWRIDAAALDAFVRSVCVAAGLAPADAAILADSLVQADLRGTPSHGVVRLPFLVKRLVDGGANPAPGRILVQEAAATALLDGDGGLGAVTAHHAMELAIAKARACGIGCVAVRNSDFIGACAHFAMQALPHDMLGMCWTNGNPGMAPWGGRSNTIGNNPIAFAAPGGRHGPLVLDMAQSVAAGGRVRLAARNGDRIPWGWLLDSEGRPTDDPAALDDGGALLPLGYKGFGLAVFGEILCGALGGARMLGEIPAWFRETGSRIGNGHLHLAIDIARFVVPAQFRDRVETMVDMLKATPLMPQVAEILMPGERAWRCARHQRQHGIALSAAVVGDLHQLARRWDLEPPPALQVDVPAGSAA